MERIILTDPEIFPEEKVLEAALGQSYAAYSTLFSTQTLQEWSLSPEWRFYNDGKAWLCKIQHKKKTVFWLSVYPECFKITFYFTEKHLDRLFDLPITQESKESLNNARNIGKLFPLTLEIRNINQLDEVRELVNFKKNMH